MAKTTFTATTPSGTTVTRSSKTKTYAFAILSNGHSNKHETRTWDWDAISWASRRDLAEKAAQGFRNRGFTGVTIVPCTTA